MLMFQSGLLASFIPEFFMVIGFLICFFTNSKGLSDDTKNLTTSNSQVVNYVDSRSQDFQYSSVFFYKIVSTKAETIVIKYFIPEIIATKTNNFIFYTSLQNFSYYFLRPPPNFKF